MKNSATIVFLIIAFLGFGQNAGAIDAALHSKVTAHAIEEYNNACVSPLQGASGAKPLDAKSGQILVDFTRHEDDLTCTRIRNWHFYDAFNGTKDAMKASQSFHRIFKKRLQEFVKAGREKNSRDLYEAGGRVLHYIQETAVPAHVAPNYHVKAEGWKGLFTKNKPDPFDEYLDPARIDYRLSTGRCEELKALNREAILKYGNTEEGIARALEALLKELADDTRREMKKSIAADSFDMKGKTWTEVFWTIRNPAQDGSYPKTVKPGFAPYAGNDDEKRFSLSGGICTSKGNNNACRTFLESRYRAVVDASIRMIMYTESMNR